MIRSFRRKPLKRLFEADDPRRLPASDLEKIKDILERLDAAESVGDMRVPGFRLHSLKGDRRGFWSVTVHANWRIIFRFEGNDAFDVDFVDYH
jgi:proteic killer suppression protein